LRSLAVTVQPDASQLCPAIGIFSAQIRDHPGAKSRVGLVIIKLLRDLSWRATRDETIGTVAKYGSASLKNYLDLTPDHAIGGNKTFAMPVWRKWSSQVQNRSSHPDHGPDKRIPRTCLKIRQSKKPSFA
jgi:hypothetical protein